MVREKIIELQKQGLNKTQIAKSLGIPRTTVRYHANAKQRKYKNKLISERRRRLKSRAVDYSGGKCLKCDYGCCEPALEFHHLDPNEKDFSLSTKGFFRVWETIEIEIQKTILLCCRCHRELHSELWIVTEDLIEKQKAVRKAYQPKPLSSYGEGFEGCFEEKPRQKKVRVRKGRRYKIEWPNNLAEMVAGSSKLAVAKQLGVSDKAVAKRLKRVSD